MSCAIGGDMLNQDGLDEALSPKNPFVHNLQDGSESEASKELAEVFDRYAAALDAGNDDAAGNIFQCFYRFFKFTSQMTADRGVKSRQTLLFGLNGSMSRFYAFRLGHSQFSMSCGLGKCAKTDNMSVTDKFKLYPDG